MEEKKDDAQQMSMPELGKKQREERRKAQEGKLPKLKLMIATPVYLSQEFSPYGDSLLETARMLTEAGVPWVKQTLRGDSYIDRAKTTIVANFLESDCTDLLMIDSDMEFSPEAVGRLLRHTQGIVGGFFPFKNNWNQFAGALQPDDEGNTPDLKTAIETWDGFCLFKAHLLPGGFLRIKREVFEQFADHYPDLVYQDPCADPGKPDRVYTAFFECLNHEHVRYGEDATFCRRIREMGLDMWVDPAIRFGHYGIKGFYGCFNDTLLKPAEELEKIRKERQELADSVKAIRVEPEVVCQKS